MGTMYCTYAASSMPMWVIPKYNYLGLYQSDGRLTSGAWRLATVARVEQEKTLITEALRFMRLKNTSVTIPF